MTTSAPPFVTALDSHGDRVALMTDTESVTYHELDARVDAVAAELGAARRLVLIGAANTVESVVAYLAALRAGNVVLLAPNDVAAIDALSARYDPDIVIAAHTKWAVRLRRARSAHELHPDLALLLSTSGTTGSPKLVRLSAANLQANADAIAEYLRLTPDDRAMSTLPMQYCYGLSVLHSHLVVGASVVLTDLSVVDRCFWDLFRRAGATSFAGVPHTFDLLDRAGFEQFKLPTLRYVTQAGGRMHPETVRRYATVGERDGWDLVVMYGQTEATARMAYLPPALAAAHPEAIGVAVPGGSLSIDSPDETGVGELVYRGPNVMLGYAEGPADLARGATVDALRTGDLAKLSPEGLHVLVGRSSRFVKLYGLRVDLDRVELLLADHGIGAMCAGSDDELVVALAGNHDPATVQRLVADRLRLPHATVRVAVFEELPRLDTGKPDYASIRAASRQGDTNDATIDGAFRAVLGVAPAAGDSFVSLGGDSLSYVEMSIRLEAALGHLPPEWHTTPVRELVPARRRRTRLARTETSVVLRAIAIVLVVGTHTKLWYLPGGAHALLVIAGFNFARFQLRTRSLLPSIARVAVPSMCWIAGVAALSDKYAWRHALLLNGPLDPHGRSGYWYVESVVYILVALALALGVPVVRRVQQRWPFAFAIGVVALGLALRFDPLAVTGSASGTSRPQDVLWLFALGWAASLARTRPRQLAVSALAVASIPGFFDNPSREAIVLGVLLLVVWLPTLVLPRVTARAVGALAGASLYIYLSHWQVYPVLDRLHGQVLATVGSLAVGIAVSWAARPALAAAERSFRKLRPSRGATGQAEPMPRAGSTEPVPRATGAFRAVGTAQNGRATTLRAPAGRSRG